MLQQLTRSKSNRYAKAFRLRRRFEFLRTQEQSRGTIKTAFFVVHSVVHGDQSVGTRLGVTASRRVGSSVVRNRIKRIVREAFRVRRENFTQATDLVVVARGRAVHAKLGDAERAIELAMSEVQHKAVC